MAGTRRRIAKEDGPDPIDLHVGERVRLRRLLVGLSQEQLADAVCITFQQIQKYERGINRISASRLFGIANALSVPVSFFFEGLEGQTTPTEPDRSGLTNEGMTLLNNYKQLSPEEQEAIQTLLAVMRSGRR